MSEINRIILKYLVAVGVNIAVGYYYLTTQPEHTNITIGALTIVIIFISYNYYKQIYR
jgi:hypothetical protein